MLHNWSFPKYMKYYLDYYKRMGWKLRPEHLLTDLAEACQDEQNDYGWRVLMHAREHIWSRP